MSGKRRRSPSPVTAQGLRGAVVDSPVFSNVVNDIQRAKYIVGDRRDPLDQHVRHHSYLKFRLENGRLARSITRDINPAFRQDMPFPERIGHLYDGVHVTGSAHLGDVYHHEPSPEKRALDAVLESLRYPGMYDRRDTLTEAHEGTFDWTFLEGETQFVEKRDENGEPEYDRFRIFDMNFKSWLQDKDEGNGIYRVVGKPGSGKSKFMRSLTANDELRQTLQGWAAADVLLRADHFFWLSGANVQKTIEGLLRSLLYSALLGFSRSDVPDKLEAINIICAPRSQIDAHSAWSRSKLKDMLTRLTCVSGVKFFFLVDALDECEPQDNLGDLATEILWMSRLSNVKLCVSHRPWDVFLRKFEHASILYLDRLTLRDMEKYVRDRLTGVEADVGRHSNFQEQTQPAEKLLRDLANAAEGVFLWTELITKAICSEMRKGKRVEQLTQVMADFPADLDKYFHELVFGRIEKSNRNIKDTAAALKLAVEINRSEQRSVVPKIDGVVENSPFARSFVNFWLLSDERLKPGFSWQEHECIAQPCIEVMIGQTASFLEETCKDLLVLNQRTKEVDFLHRTVFDFLTDKKADVALEEDAPAHFSDENFLFNLAKLRCICILRADRAEVEAITGALDYILSVFQNVSHLDKNASWLLACESLTILQLQKVHGYRGQGAMYVSKMPSRCVKAGLGKFVLEFYKHVPAFVHMKSDFDLDLLGELLQAATNADVRSPDIALYRCIMEYGCNPNAHIDKWPTMWIQRHPFGSDIDNPGLEWCDRTTWQAWLGEAYLQTQRRVTAGSSAQIDRVLDTQKQWFGAVVDLLLRHGADPSCTICITDHEEKQEEQEEQEGEPEGRRTSTTCSEASDTCHHVALEQLLGQIVPTECIAQLQTLRNLCCDERIACIIRRNRQKQAVRSLLISEQNLSTKPPTDVWMPLFTKERLRRRFFESLTGARSSEVPGLPSPCTNLTVPRASQDEDHTGVVFVWEREDSEDLNTRLRGYADILHARYPTDHAIDGLKDWYNKNPIEPDLTFEEATHDIASLLPPSGQHQTSEDDTTGDSSAEVPPRNAIKRSRTGIEDSEVVSKRHTAVHTPIPTRRGSQEVLASETPGEAAA